LSLERRCVDICDEIVDCSACGDDELCEEVCEELEERCLSICIEIAEREGG